MAASACDVLFVDTMIRSGRGVDYFPIRPPYVPGNGVGGTIAALGAGVDAGWLGRPVVAHTGGAGGTGGYAELAAVDFGDCASVPDDVDLLEATAVLHDGTTALRVLEKTAPMEGEWVLVLGAAGGMGLLLVQLLAGRGAQGCGCRPRFNETRNRLGGRGRGGNRLRRSRLDRCGARRQRRATSDRRARRGRRNDRRGSVRADRRRRALLGAGTPSGSFALIDSAEAERRGVTVTTIADLQYGEGDRSRLLAAILAEIGAGRVAPLVGQTFSLAEAAKAHLAIESRETVAKTLLLPP